MSDPDYLTMSLDELRMECAQRMGWHHVVDHFDGRVDGFPPGVVNSVHNIEQVPDYPRDRCAALELEDDIERREAEAVEAYTQNLHRLIVRGVTSVWTIRRATATQIAIAYCQTVPRPESK